MEPVNLMAVFLAGICTDRMFSRATLYWWATKNKDMLFIADGKDITQHMIKMYFRGILLNGLFVLLLVWWSGR